MKDLNIYGNHDFFQALKTLIRVLNEVNFHVVIKQTKNKEEMIDIFSKAKKQLKLQWRKVHPDKERQCDKNETHMFQNANANLESLLFINVNDEDKLQIRVYDEDFFSILDIFYNVRNKLECLNDLTSKTFDTANIFERGLLNNLDIQLQKVNNAKTKINSNLKKIVNNLFISGEFGTITPYEGDPPVCCILNCNENDNKQFTVLTCCQKIIHKDCLLNSLCQRISQKDSKVRLLEIYEAYNSNNNNDCSMKYDIVCPSCENVKSISIMDIPTEQNLILTKMRNISWFNDIYFRMLNTIRNLKINNQSEKLSYQQEINNLKNKIILLEEKNRVNDLNLSRNDTTDHDNSIDSYLNNNSSNNNTNLTNDSRISTNDESFYNDSDNYDNEMDCSSDCNNNNNSYEENSYNNSSMIKHSEKNQHDQNNNRTNLDTIKEILNFQPSGFTKKQTSEFKIQYANSIIKNLPQEQPIASYNEDEKTFHLKCPYAGCSRTCSIKNFKGGAVVQAFRTHRCPGYNMEKVNLTIKGIQNHFS